MSYRCETFIQLHFRQDHWENALANRKPVPELYGMDEQCIEIIKEGIIRVNPTWKPGPTTFSHTNVNIVTSRITVGHQTEEYYYSLLEGLNIPYEAFEDANSVYQRERRFNPMVSPEAKSVHVIYRAGDYYLDYSQLKELQYKTPEQVQQAIYEALNPFRDYPELRLL